MSLREEEQRKNNCPSRGLGLAAAAIGVGVGAALYYFFSKRPENPAEEGSTSSWACEQPHAFNVSHEESDASMENHCSTSDTSEGSYITESEATTTDTSVHDSSSVSHSEEHSSTDVSDVVVISSDESFELDFESDEWDMTHSSLDIPEQQNWSQQQSPLRALVSLLSPFANRTTRRKTRERSWSLEECSICFEIMLKDQQLTSLPCSHNFHSGCIAPWLAEQQTCPNCRKAAE